MRTMEDINYIFIRYLSGTKEVALFKHKDSKHLERWGCNVPLYIENRFRDRPFLFDNKQWIYIGGWESNE